MSHPAHSTNRVNPMAETMRQRRVERRMSLRNVSDVIGYHYNTVAGFENGKRTPSYMFLINYAQLLGLEVRLCESSAPTK